MNAAALGIGGSLIMTNPITGALMTDVVMPSAGHAAKVMMNPATAKTTAGAMAATMADAYGVTSGIYRNSELLNNW